MASALAPLFGDAPGKPGADGSVGAATRFHPAAESSDPSGKCTHKSEQWQPSMEALESRRASKKHEEERKRFLAHEANEIKKYSSFEEETTHPVPEKTGDHHKETPYSFLRKGSLELFSSQGLYQPLEQKEVSTGMQGKWEVKKGQSFEEKMDLGFIMKSKTWQRGVVITCCWCGLIQQLVFQALSRLVMFPFSNTV